ncbi:unnamed protein product [Caenorhabditis nigoni]
MSRITKNTDSVPQVTLEVVDEKGKKILRKEIKESVNSLLDYVDALKECMDLRMETKTDDEIRKEKAYLTIRGIVSNKLRNLVSLVKDNIGRAIGKVKEAHSIIVKSFAMIENTPPEMDLFKDVADELKDLAEFLEKAAKESGNFVWSDSDDDDADDDEDGTEEPSPKRFKTNNGSVHQSGGNQSSRSRKSATDRSAHRAGDEIGDDDGAIGNAEEPKEVIVALTPVQAPPPMEFLSPKRTLDTILEDEEEGEDGEDVEDEEEEEDGEDVEDEEVEEDGKDVEDEEEEQPKEGENEKELAKEREHQQQSQINGNRKGIEQLEEYGVEQNALGQVVDGSEEQEEPQQVESEQGADDQMQADQPQSSNAGQQFEYDDFPGTSSSATKEAKVSRKEMLREKLSAPLYFTAMCAKAYLQSADLSPAEMERAREIVKEIQKFEESRCSVLIGAKEDADFKAFDEVLKNIRRAMDLPPTAANRPTRTQKAESKRDGKHRALDLENERANLSFLILTSKLNPVILNSDGRTIVETARGFNLKNVYDTTGLILTTTNPRLKNKFFAGKGFDNAYRGKTCEVLKTLCIETSHIKSEEDVKELEGTLEKCSSAILRGIGKSLKINEKLFTADQLATDAPKLEVEIKTQLATSSWTSKHLTVDHPNRGGEHTWKMADKSKYVTLKEAVDVHKKTEEVTREEMERYLKGDQSTSTFWHDWNKRLIDAQEHNRRSEMVSHFITNVDITNELFPKQYAEISKLWEFLRPSTRFMSQIDGVISGINGVQAYLKEAGSVTSGHTENLVAGSVNWNIGPGDCVWYMVPAVFSGKMEAVLAKKNISPYETPYWPLEKALKDENISYEKIVQKPDDMIVVGVGTYHWVQANGPCVNVSWNIAERTTTQLRAMALFNDHAVSQRYSPVLPLEAMIWNDAKRCQLENSGYNKLRLSLLTRSLARCQNELEYAVEVKALKPTPIEEYLHSGISREARELTNNPMCGNPTCPRRMLFNFFCVTQSGIIVCIGCYNEQGKNPKCYYKNTVEELITVFDQYRAAMLSQGTS